MLSHTEEIVDWWFLDAWASQPLVLSLVIFFQSPTFQIIQLLFLKFQIWVFCIRFLQYFTTSYQPTNVFQSRIWVQLLDLLFKYLSDDVIVWWVAAEYFQVSINWNYCFMPSFTFPCWIRNQTKNVNDIQILSGFNSSWNIMKFKWAFSWSSSEQEAVTCG